jgi:hypothetical protein
MRKTQKMHERIRREFERPLCKEGQVIREGYERPAYMRKNGTYVSSTKVRPGCIRGVGMSKKRGRKGRQLFVLQKGTLSQYGYHADRDQLERHDALDRALIYTKPLSLYRKLNALYVLNKNKNPKMAALFRGDADWVKTRPEYLNRPM